MLAFKVLIFAMLIVLSLGQFRPPRMYSILIYNIFNFLVLFIAVFSQLIK